MENNTLDHFTHTGWNIWYHNPLDKNWALSSYSKLYEFNSLEGFWDVYKNWNTHLPYIYDGMFFLMRKRDKNIVYPMWEDKNNKNGGFWSFKVEKELAEKIWLELSIYLISEKLCVNEKDNNIINGISISPKKSFCIIKIWNNTTVKSDLAILNQDMDYLNFDECMYKCHNDNIANDKLKSKKYKYGNTNNTNNENKAVFSKKKKFMK